MLFTVAHQQNTLNNLSIYRFELSLTFPNVMYFKHYNIYIQIKQSQHLFLYIQYMEQHWWGCGSSVVNAAVL